MQQRAQPKAIASPAPSARFWGGPTLWLALAGAVLLWASFPPLNLWPLAWLAPLPWLWLILLPELPGRRPFVAIWLAGLVHWLLLLQGIRLAHPALYGGWLVLAVYLAFYLPAFIGLTRVAVHRLGISIVVAAPVVWVGLELIRGHLATGFSLALLAHTQTGWTMLLQIADLGGAYAVSFVMMTVTAAIARVIPIEVASKTHLPRTLNPAVAAIALVATTLGYGAWRLNQPPAKPDAPTIRVALIQGSRDTEFTSDPAYFRETLEHYQRLTDQARREHERLDLVAWPESMFVVQEIRIEEPLAPPAGIPADAFRRRKEAANDDFAALLAQETARVNTLPGGSPQATPTLFLFGANTWVIGSGDRQRSYNAALLADPDGQVVGRYYKQHAVMFGEYIPFGEMLPLLYRLTPMTGGMSVGDGPRPLKVGGLTLSPSICFESVVPHLIRGDVTRLARQGQPADVLVNVTNDGWFGGSAILDLHFRCAVYRAVENRKPMIVVANTGISTWIDGNGHVRLKGPRRAPAVLIADVGPDGRSSPYHVLGDVPAWLCGLACLALAAVGWRKRRA